MAWWCKHFFELPAGSGQKVVGAWLAKYAQALHDHQRGVYLRAIGHSLGAHTVGKAGRDSHGAFKRITGLNPASPWFEKVNKSLGLWKTDVHIVDVIHTDGYHPTADPKEWTSLMNHKGTLIPMGHTSISIRPTGCLVNLARTRVKIAMDELMTCLHEASPDQKLSRPPNVEELTKI